MTRPEPRRLLSLPLLSILIGLAIWAGLFFAFLIVLGIKSSSGDPLTQEILEQRSQVATRFLIRMFWIHLAVGGVLGIGISIPIAMVRPKRRKSTLWLFHGLTVFLLIVYGTVSRPVFADAWLNVHGGILADFQGMLTAWFSPTLVLVLAGAIPSLYVLAHAQGRRALSSRRGLIWATLGVALIGATKWPSAKTPPKDLPPNVLLLGMDSLRSDHLSCAGYPRPTTPNIDALAERGVRFQNVFTSLARTLPSWASLLTSTYPHDHGLRDMFPTRDRRQIRVPTLPTKLADQDYRSFVVSDYAGESFALVDFGFEDVVVPPRTTLSLVIQREILLAFPIIIPAINHRLGHRVVDVLRYLTINPHPFILNQHALEKVDDAIEEGRPFVGTVFYSGPHNPYTSPYPGYQMFTSDSYMGPNKYAFAVRDPRRVAEIENELPKEDIDQIIALYDGATATTDRAIGELLASLEDRGVLDNTIVIFTSDHGEHLYENGNFVDHGKWFRGGDAATKVPLIFAGPRLPKDGRVIDEPVRQLDIFPTLMQLLGTPLASEHIAGTDLTALLDDPHRELDLPIFSETGLWLASNVVFRDEPDALTYPEITDILTADGKDDTLILRPELYDLTVTAKHRMYQRGQYKLVYEPTKNGANYRLYDVMNDPANQNNLAAIETERLEAMKRELHRWLARDPARKVAQNGHVIRDWTYFE